MNWTSDDIPDQSGKLFLITGANSGLGFAATRELILKEATVIMACRDIKKANKAKNEIVKKVPSAEELAIIEKLDLASLTSITKFTDRIINSYDKLDVLMNNAGLMATPQGYTEDKFELQFGVNHLGHYALTGMLLHLLRKTGDSRIVTTTSSSHNRATMDFDDLFFERNYKSWAAYYRSKLANLLFTYELQRKFDTSKIETIAIAAHPGYVATELQLKGMKKQRAPLRKLALTFGNKFVAQSLEKGVLCQLYAATSNDAGGGKYYGPGGLFGLRGYPTEKKSSNLSYNIIVARKLWELSEEFTGIEFDFS